MVATTIATVVAAADTAADVANADAFDVANASTPLVVDADSTTLGGLGWHPPIMAQHGHPAMQVQVQLSALGHPSITPQVRFEPSGGLPPSSDSNA